MDISNLNVILKKTEKGLSALKVRDPLLSQKARILLILIDGKKTLGELAPLVTIGSDTHEKFKELLQADFVAEVSNQEPVQPQLDASNTASAIIKLETANSAQNLQGFIRSSCRMLTDMLGPNADVLCIQLEKCKSKDEYNAKILEFKKIIGAMRSVSIANDFVNKSAM